MKNSYLQFLHKQGNASQWVTIKRCNNDVIDITNRPANLSVIPSQYYYGSGDAAKEEVLFYLARDNDMSEEITIVEELVPVLGQAFHIKEKFEKWS